MAQRIITGARLFKALEIRETRGITKLIPSSHKPLPKVIEHGRPMRLMAGLVDSNMLASWFHRCHDSHNLYRPEEWR
jgi:hypothetical protein